MKSGTIARLLLSMLAVAAAAQQAPVATFGTTVYSSAGLVGRIYFLPDGAPELPRFGDLQPVGVIYTPVLNVPPQHWLAGFPGVTDRFEWFAIDYRGNFWIEKPGLYRFSLTSDDGSGLFIDDQQIIDNDGQHPPETRFATFELNRGFHRLHVPYFQGPRDTVALVLEIAGPGQELRIFSTDEFKPPANPDDWIQADLAPADPVQEDPPAGSLPKFTSTVLVGGGLTANVYRASRRNSGRPLDTFYAAAARLPDRLSKSVQIEYSGGFWIGNPGLYRFALIADDGAELSIDGQLIDDDNQPHDFERNRRFCSLRLSPGAHRLQLVFQHGKHGRPLLGLYIARPGEAFREFSTQDFSPPPNAEEH